MVAARAERDEIPQVVRCAAVRDRLDVVNLEPLAACAADGAAMPVAAEGGCNPADDRAEGQLPLSRNAFLGPLGG